MSSPAASLRPGLPPARPGLPPAEGSCWRSPRTTGRSKAEYGLRIAGRDERCQSMNECLALPALNPDQCFQSFRWRGSNAVIEVARQYGRGPVNLFQKHDAHHLVRPGSGAECDAQFCLAPQIRRKSVRAADHENSVGDRLIPPAGKMPGKNCAVDIVAALIQRHQHRFCRDCARNRRSFLRDPGGGVARPAFRNFMDLEAAKTGFAADVVEALAI